MAYTPNTWATGDTITATKLNNMEQGIASAGVLYITATWDDTEDGYVLDKTLAQIKAAYSNGQTCKVVGGVAPTEVTVAAAPWGDMVVLSDALTVDIGSNELNLHVYDLDQQTEVLTQDIYRYALTPAS